MIVTELINFRNILVHMYVIVVNVFQLHVSASATQHEQVQPTGFCSHHSCNRFLLVYRLSFLFSHVCSLSYSPHSFGCRNDVSLFIQTVYFLHTRAKHDSPHVLHEYCDEEEDFR
jgi:hypothetical protein